ncbi:MAG: hypothetical protein H6816_15970 [Phycisphaerales bacterium]|nr:hypothetical protein [Phycisphaerales bacterium]
MALQILEPFNQSIQHTKKVLFRPFDLGRWFTIGFCAWISSFLEGGGNFSGIWNMGGRGGGGGGGWPGFPGGQGGSGQPFGLSTSTLIAIVALLVLLGIAVSLVFAWVGARGRFMFIDNIARSRGAVVAPWREYRPQGNSLFLFLLVYGIAFFLVMIVLLAVAGVIALPDIRARSWGPAATMAVVVGAFTVVPLGLVGALVSFVLHNFVVPTMYLWRVGAMEAWRIVRIEVLGPHLGACVLYFLFRIVIFIGIGIVATGLTCATCCMTAIPYLGTVILLPLFVFSQSYALMFLQQIGPQWSFVQEEGLRCERCHYDLTGLVGADRCPECGLPIAQPVGEVPPTERPPEDPEATV